MYKKIAKLLDYCENIPRFAEKELGYKLSSPQQTLFKRIQTDKPLKILISAGRGCGKCVEGNTLISTEKGLERAKDLEGKYMKSLEGLSKILKKRRFDDDLLTIETKKGYRITVASKHLMFSRKSGNLQNVSYSFDNGHKIPWTLAKGLSNTKGLSYIAKGCNNYQRKSKYLSPIAKGMRPFAKGLSHVAKGCSIDHDHDLLLHGCKRKSNSFQRQSKGVSHVAKGVRHVAKGLSNNASITAKYQEYYNTDSMLGHASELLEGDEVLLAFGLHKFPNKGMINEAEAEFLGLVSFWASYSIHKFMTIGRRNPLLRKRFEDLIKKCFGLWVEKREEVCRSCTASITKFCSRVGFHPSLFDQKKLPEKIFTEPENVIRAFLKGAIILSQEKGERLSISHPSETLLRETQTLLAALGFPATVERKRKSFELQIIEGDDFLSYIQEKQPKPKPFSLFEEVKEIRKSRGKVFAFEVEEPHIYFANNFVSHNSFSAAVSATWSSIIFPYIRDKPYKTIVLGGSERQAKKVYSYIRQFVNKSDFVADFIKGELQVTKARLRNGSEIFVFPCSEKAVRHEHVDLLIVDEAASAKNEIIRAALPVIDEADFPRMLFLSTPHNPSSLFVTIFNDYETWGFEKPFIWQSKDCFWKNPKEVARKKRVLSKHEFDVEYKGLPMSLEGNIIDLKSFQQCRVTRIDTKPNYEKVIGVDWGFAPPKSITVICVVQLNKKKQSYEVIEHKTLHGGPGRIHDSIIQTAKDYDSKTIFADSSHKSDNQSLREKGVVVREVVFQRRLPRMIQRLQRLIEQGKLKIPEKDSKLISQMTMYRWTEKSSGHVTPDKSIPVDYIDSLHCALEGFRHKFAVFQFASGKYGG